MGVLIDPFVLQKYQELGIQMGAKLLETGHWELVSTARKESCPTAPPESTTDTKNHQACVGWLKPSSSILFVFQFRGTA